MSENPWARPGAPEEPSGSDPGVDPPLVPPEHRPSPDGVSSEAQQAKVEFNRKARNLGHELSPFTGKNNHLYGDYFGVGIKRGKVAKTAAAVSDQLFSTSPVTLLNDAHKTAVAEYDAVDYSAKAHRKLREATFASLVEMALSPEGREKLRAKDLENRSKIEARNASTPSGTRENELQRLITQPDERVPQGIDAILAQILPELQNLNYNETVASKIESGAVTGRVIRE